MIFGKPLLWAARCFTSIVALLTVAHVSFASDKLAVGYYPAWQRYAYPAEKVAFENLTHVTHAFVWPNADGTLATYSDFHYPQLVERAHQAGRKIMVSLGGWGQSEGFSPVAANAATRAKFIENIKNFCVTYKYDGVDIDWEYPQTAADRANLTLLVTELREVFDTFNPPLVLSMAVPAGGQTNNRFDFAALKDKLDWIGCMTYDFHGSWTNHSGHLAPLYAPSSDPCGSADLSIKYLISVGVPREKILMGLAFYGREFNTTALYAPSTGGAAVIYKDAMTRITAGWTYHWDDLSKNPYLTNSDNTKLVSFDDTVSIRIKCEYVRQNNLAGAKIWALGHDDMGSSQPLLAVVGRELGTITSVKEHDEFASLPGSPTLLQAYPNPFNPSTTLRYFVPHTSEVRLEVFDLTGKVVAVLVNEEQREGWHQVVWQAENRSSGIYLSRLRAGKSVVTHKLTLMR